MAKQIFSDSDFLPDTDDAAAAADPSTSATPQTTFSDADFDETLPSHANGLSPEVAINESPLTAWERFKLSTGQVGGSMSGNVKWLGEKFGRENVSKDKAGNLVVKDQSGLWKQIDEQDAWSKSAMIGDAADVAPMVIDVAVDGIVGAVSALATGATGGAAAPASLAAFVATQGIQSEARATLGKLWGTYRPDNYEEEIADVGLEMLFSAGAGKLLKVGQKPTAPVIGNMFEKSESGLKNLAESTKTGLKSLLGYLHGTNADLVDDVITEAGPIGRTLKSFGPRATSEDIVAGSIQETANIVKDISRAAQPIKSSVWRRGAQEIDDAIGRPVALEAGQIYNETVASMVDAGLVKVIDPATKLPIAGGDMIRKGMIKPSKATVLSKSAEELAGSLQEKYHPDMPAMLEKLVSTLDGFAKIPKHEGVAKILDSRHAISNTLDDFISKAHKEDVSEFGRIVNTIKSNVDGSIEGVLGERGAPLYRALRENYENMSYQFSPFTRIDLRDKEAVENVARNLLSVNMTKSTKGDAIQQMLSVAKRASPILSKRIEDNFRNIRVWRATAAYSKFIKPSQWASPAVGLGAGALLTGNATLGVGAVAPFLATSPRLFLGGVQAAQGASAAASRAANKPAARAVINTARTVRSALGRLTPRGRQLLWSNPVLANQVLMSIPKTLGTMEQVDSELKQRMQNVGVGQ